MGIVALTTALVHPFATEVARYSLELNCWRRFYMTAGSRDKIAGLCAGPSIRRRVRLGRCAS